MISERCACRYTGFARASQRYQLRRPRRAELRDRLHTLAVLRPRRGYRRLYRLLRHEGRVENKKLVQRVCREEGLHVYRRKRKRVAVRRVAMAIPDASERPMEHGFRQRRAGRRTKFQAVTIVDDVTRESPAIEVDFSLPGARVVRVLNGLGQTRDYPKAIVLDNGPEFRGEALDQWAACTAWRCISSSRASRPRVPSPKASTAGFAINA